jgi:predicted PhzF superfamily epimerase YddE/YHI9
VPGFYSSSEVGWDNDGRVEDIATSSAGGPAGAYLVAHGLVNPAQTIEISQGRLVGRPSTLFVVAQKDDEGRISVKVAGDFRRRSTRHLKHRWRAITGGRC